jgi:hypothetical protein
VESLTFFIGVFMIGFGKALEDTLKALIGVSIASGIVLTATAWGVTSYYRHRGHKSFPRTAIMQREYVSPADLEVKVQDRDEIKGNELYLRVKGQEYQFRYDARGTPVLVPVQSTR